MKGDIVKAAVKVMAAKGYDKMTGASVAREMKVKQMKIFSQFDSVESLRCAVVRLAILRVRDGDENKDYLRIIGKAIAGGNELVKKLPDEIKLMALKEAYL